MAGAIEFPGGKLEPGESIDDALVRELHEELGITARNLTPVIALRHDYPELSVNLSVRRVGAYHGSVSPREGQKLDWVAPSALGQHALLEADWPVLHALQLPDHYWITPPAASADTLLNHTVDVLDQGVDMVHCRLPGLDGAARKAAAQSVRALCAQYNATFIYHGSMAQAQALAAHGIHMTARTLAQIDKRPAFEGWVSASCHHHADIKQANRCALDYIVIGTVQPSASHPGEPTLGWSGFKALAAHSNRPAYAIGGLTVDDIPTAHAQGGQGIAAIRGLLSRQSA